ncbi:SCO4225 family membrane protein [Streptomyces fradiae]|uniref:SCO4225 family membrane protein n=1 Tax=Streptomyces fradiae TaxID=1906 RepID=UPI00381B7E56
MTPHRTLGTLPRTAARLAFGNIASGVYLAVVAVVGALVAHNLLLTEHEDASFAAVWLVLVAAPAMPALLAGGALAGDAALASPWFFWAAFAVAVFLQSLAVGALARLVTGAPRRQARPQGG